MYSRSQKFPFIRVHFCWRVMHAINIANTVVQSAHLNNDTYLFNLEIFIGFSGKFWYKSGSVSSGRRFLGNGGQKKKFKWEVTFPNCPLFTPVQNS